MERPSDGWLPARIALSALGLATIAAVTTAGELLRREPDRPTERPWVTRRAIGGPRLHGDLGSFEVGSPLVSVRASSDPIAGPTPPGFASHLHRQARHLYDCYNGELTDGDPAFETRVTIRAVLWPSGGLSGVEISAEPEMPHGMAWCVSETANDLRGLASSRTDTVPIVVRLDFSRRASGGPS